jgi:molecular chaperone GrpE
VEQPVEENRQEEILDETVADETEDAAVTDEEMAQAQGEEVSEDKASQDQSEEEQEEQKKRGLFGKKKKDKRDTQIEELTDRVQRQMAEFDNFRKRSEKEKSAMYEVGAKSVIEKILPTIDNFERGFAGLTEEQKADPFVEGMEKVYRQMLTMLESIGVTAIEAVGQPFDPNFHNAVMHVEDEEAGENTVVEEFQKGYLYRDSVVRHSMVKVAN